MGTASSQTFSRVAAASRSRLNSAAAAATRGRAPITPDNFSPVVVPLSLDGRELITATTLAKGNCAASVPARITPVPLDSKRHRHLGEDPLQVADLAAAMCLQTGSLVQGVVCAGHVP